MKFKYSALFAILVAAAGASCKRQDNNNPNVNRMPFSQPRERTGGAEGPPARHPRTDWVSGLDGAANMDIAGPQVREPAMSCRFGTRAAGPILA